MTILLIAALSMTVDFDMFLMIMFLVIVESGVIDEVLSWALDWSVIGFLVDDRALIEVISVEGGFWERT